MPWFGLDQPAHAGQWLKGLLHIAIFISKIVMLVIMVMWVRWMLPRFRFDQLMDLGWRRILPVALANIVVTAVILWMNSL